MKQNSVKTNFTAGELSPRLFGYADFEKYGRGAKQIRNLIVYPHGGVTRRPGSQYVTPTKFDGAANNTARLVAFSFSASDNYVLEFGHLYVRFYKHQTAVLDGANPVEIVTEYTVDDIHDLYFVQTADVLFIVHPGHHPKELSRITDTNWTFEDIPFDHPEPVVWVPGDYPSVIALYQQRMILAASPSHPQHIWASAVGDFYSFKVPASVDESSPFTYQIASDNINAILWMSVGEVVTIGTVGAEFAMSASRAGEAITATNVKITRETNYGSAVGIPPVRIDNSVLYVTTGGRKVREHAFDFYTNGAIGADVTILSEHITKYGLYESTYQNSPNSILWLLRADGRLAGLTYEKEQKVLAWHQHNLGGKDVKILSMVSVNGTLDVYHPDFSADADELWVVVERMVNGVKRTYVETMVNQNVNEITRDDLLYLDCSLRGKFPSGTKTVSNLGHLEGETVQVLVDGATHPDRVVTAGRIDLDVIANTVHVGYQEDAIVETMPLLDGGNQGEAFMQTKRISRVRLMIYKSLGIKIGPNENEMDWVYMEPGKMDNPPDLVTGVEVEDFPGDFEYEGTVLLKQTQPLPLTLLALVAEYRTQ